MNALHRYLPFLRWFPLKAETARPDFIAGVTVALVLIPQSMAYAQLAGMPAYYGLYAAFLPVAIASMFGSSNFLGTGPVAVVSLLTASSLAPLASPGSAQFVALAILLALMVGVVQLSLGLFKLGVVVNFLSHPVIVGFTNAAAIIIGLSQVSKLFGVSMGRSESFMKDIWGVALQLGDTHLPTLAMGLLGIGLMWGLKRFLPRWPGVLIAVVVTTTLSWAIGFEKNTGARIDEVADVEARTLLAEFDYANGRIAQLNGQLEEKTAKLNQVHEDQGEFSHDAATLNYEIDLIKLELHDRENENRKRNRAMRSYLFERVPASAGQPARFYPLGKVPAGERSDGNRWRIRKVAGGGLKLSGGGEVVGKVPEGLPAFQLPTLDLGALGSLLSTAIVISLVGFMEAISIAKALATKAKQKVDPNQELIGQGLANIVGGFTQSFPVSGSFSRSAVNFNAGARSGFSAVVTALSVLITLLFLTPLLYHLPQAVLAAIIIMAVIGLVNFSAVKHAWQASRHDGVAAMVTFVATLLVAPDLDRGIMIGAGLAILLYLYRTMTPRVAQLGRYADGTLRDIKVNPGLPTSPHITAIRFDGSLYFANVAYFEDTILEAVAAKPDAEYVLVVGDAINQLDASGEEVVHHLVSRLRDGGTGIVFSGLKKQVLDVMRQTGLFELIGQENIFATEDQAIAAIYERLGETAQDSFCALNPARA
ncbi:STAS domain-containing protein [Parasulfuritortus cantonensis]|uniref:STAS domain-containing protein n=1 Tax=Parasulfuritortus cantonensis TaxID=2528202 RepID=A0A4R1BRH6_9PROT|nr:SulP family inorganic anion transporter [Parasulfuritortus cantonensis]TCJ20241.1 STAS domain-containing protein [Parasulfuritortus cantonensis]